MKYTYNYLCIILHCLDIITAKPITPLSISLADNGQVKASFDEQAKRIREPKLGEMPLSPPNSTKSVVTVPWMLPQQITLPSGLWQPSLPIDFPDPSLIQVGTMWYSFATTANGKNVQMARSNDFRTWQTVDRDALPTPPKWVHAASPQIWAPDVVQRDDGAFVMYFSAAVGAAGLESKHCVGAAVASYVEGPYLGGDVPLVCPDPSGDGSNRTVPAMVWSPGAGGAIDASGFRDSDGSRYVVYKVDGNSLGGGGPCGNVGKWYPTPLMSLQVGADGITPVAKPVQLLDRTDSDGPLVEAPNLSRLKDGSYALLFSSNCFNTPQYDIGWARSLKVNGPYVRQNPLLITGYRGLIAPGGASIAADGAHMVFHANWKGGRSLFVSTLGDNSSQVRL